MEDVLALKSLMDNVLESSDFFDEFKQFIKNLDEEELIALSSQFQEFQYIFESMMEMIEQAEVGDL